MADIEMKNKIIEDQDNPEANLLGKKKKRCTKKDPLLVQSVSLNSDIYALTWNACRTQVWEDLELHGEKISLTNADHAKIVVHFIFFLLVVIATVGILLIESFIKDSYTDATWPIYILRITLVAFAQRNLEPEMFQGLAIYRYTLKRPEEFFHPCFAKVVGLSQFYMALFAFIAIFLFVCMANEAINLIMNFAGLAVISELDDWVGDQIMSESIPTEFDEDSPYKDAILQKDNLNERMSFYSKLCLVGEDMEIEDDQNVQVSLLTILANKLPWFLIPLLTIPSEYILLWLQGRAQAAAIIPS